MTPCSILKEAILSGSVSATDSYTVTSRQPRTTFSAIFPVIPAPVWDSSAMTIPSPRRGAGPPPVGSGLISLLSILRTECTPKNILGVGRRRTSSISTLKKNSGTGLLPHRLRFNICTRTAMGNALTGSRLLSVMANNPIWLASTILPYGHSA